ncbi:unnamed protein product, partial [Staurois parvus]
SVPSSASHLCQQCTHLCPAVPTSATQHPAVLPVSATSQCPTVVPVSAQHLRQSMPSSAASQCPAVIPVSATYQWCLSVPIISATYPCHPH